MVENCFVLFCCTFFRIRTQPTQLYCMASFHSNTHLSFYTCFHLLCQAVRKSVFPLHSYAIHSTQTATTQLQSAPLPFFSLSVWTTSSLLSLSPTPLERQQTDVAGDEADGKDDRRKFLEKEMKTRRCEQQDESVSQTQLHTVFAFLLLYLLDVCKLYKQPCWFTHTDGAYALYNKPV